MTHRSIRLVSHEGGQDECTVPGRVEPSRTRRAGGAAERWQACSAQAQAGADPAGGRWRGERRGDCGQRRGRRLDGVPDQAALRGGQPGGGAERGPRPGARRKLTGKEEALLVATAYSKPPAGRARWTLELLAGEMVKLTEHGGLSRETVRRRLAENDLKPWRKDMWCIPQ